MATYRDLCKDALITSTAVGALDVPTDKEINTALSQLNHFLARWAIRANMSPKKVIYDGTSDSNGQLSIKKTQSNPTESKIIGSIGLVTRVINQDNYELSFLDFSVYCLKNLQTQTNHNYYTTQAGESDEVIVYSAVGSVIKVIADAGYNAHGLDDIFDYPEYYWDVFEYGLASKLAILFKVDPNIQMNLLDVYKSAVNDVESYNVQMSPLNSNKADQGNFYNGYM